MRTKSWARWATCALAMMIVVHAATAHRGRKSLNLPLAAAFAVVPIVLIGLHLALARRLGAFDAL